MDEKIVRELINQTSLSWEGFKREYMNKLKELEQNGKTNKISTNLKLIGKCYKFRNSYSQSEKWWLYIKIVGIEKDGDLIIHKFQKDNYGRIEIESETTWSDFEGDNDYIPISEKEYKKATDLLLQEMIN